MSNAPTIITSPSPLIANQPGSITYYVDISQNNTNTFPAPATTYTLQGTGQVTNPTFTSKTNCEDITSNYQNPLVNPAACTFDNNGYFYTIDYGSSIITAYNPSFNQTTNLSYVYQPIGIKINSSNGLLYVVNLVGTGTQFGSITILSPIYNSSLNPGASNYNYSYFISTNDYYANWLNYPYDIVFDNSGNAIVSNIGYYAAPSPATGCFIVKFIVKNNAISSVVPLVYNSNTGNQLSVSPSWSSGLNDGIFSSPSGMVCDLSKNYLYVANNDPNNPTRGQITIYNLSNSPVTKVNRIFSNSVGNSTYPAASGVSISTLQLDSYGNLYYIYNSGSSIFVRATTFNGTSFVNIFNHQITNSANLTYFYGLSLFNGNIYVTGIVSGNKTSVIEIQTALTFNNVTLAQGQNQNLTIYNGATLSASFNVSVPGSNTLISNNLPRYTNQASILTYYDNPNNANYLVPTGGTTYVLNETSSNNSVDSVTMVANNEILYAPYNNELGSLSYPISMDFDGSGNLYILNNPINGQTNLTIITQNSGNFQEYYTGNLSINYPTAIRYNKYDNNMYLTSFDINYYGTIYQVVTKTITNGTQVYFNLTESIFYTSPYATYFCYLPIDLVFDENYMYVSCAGSMQKFANPSVGYQTLAWNANITKIPIIYGSTTTLGSPTILVPQNYLSNYISGIEVDSSYIYVVNAPSYTSYDASGNTNSYSNCYTNISQFNKVTGQLLRRFNSGYVGKLPDLNSKTSSSKGNTLNPNNVTFNIGSSLRFDPSYNNLYYIVYYSPNNYSQPYYLYNGSIVFSTSSSSSLLGNYYIQAFSPSSGLDTPIFSHKMSNNPTASILGMALYNGDIYVAQYTKNQIIKLQYSLSFGNYGFGQVGSESSLVLYNTNNSYYITGGNSSIYGINITAQLLNYAFDTSNIITSPTPLLANCPGTLYFYDNPATTSPSPGTTYVLKNASGKNVSNTYTPPPGNETTIIYNNLSSTKSLSIDNQGYLYIANAGHVGTYANGSIVKTTTTGQVIYTKTNENIQNPYAIKYNPIDGFIYYSNITPKLISGIEYFYIYKMSTDGNTFTQVYQDSSLNYLYNVQDMCFDSLGNIYVSNGYTTTTSGNPVNGGITKITLDYSSGSASPMGVQVFSDFLSGLTLNYSSNVILSGLAIDTITNYLYVVSGANDASGNNINISQMPLTGNDAGKVCRKWQTGKVGNAQGQTALNFDGYGNLYYYYYDTTSKVGYLKGFDPYTNTSATYTHTLLGGATSGAYGIIYYEGDFYSTQSSYNSSTGVYIDNLVKINASYNFTGVTLQAGQNVLSINTTITNQVTINNIVASASTPKYYTIPTQPNAGQPAQLIFEYDGVITPINGHNYVVIDSNMNYVSSILNYNSATEPNPYTFTFNNLVLPGGANYLYIFDITTGQIVNIPLCNSTNGYIFIKIPIVCFYKGTKILCAINGKDTYVPIEKIGQGTLVKTYKQGYKRVKYNVMGKLNNTKEHSIDKLFKLSKKRFPNLGLTEDLYVTGSHALLHDSLNEREVILMKKVIQYAASNYKSIYNAKIEDKYKLLAYHDERFEEIMMNSVFEIYHIVLENENENFNYGIYANGVLAESTDELTLMRMKGFEKINKTPETLEKFVNAMNTNKYPNQLRRALNK